MSIVRVRPTSPRAAKAFGAEAFVVLVAAAAIGGLYAVGRDWASPLVEAAPIDLSVGALPKYTLFSLTRGVVAYGFSLVFTIVYATAAARSARAERVMIPVLDVLQSIPVLSFIPGLVAALEALFPTSNFGLEIACVLAIFTGQVWNMTFSYHASLRAIPSEQREVAHLFRFGRWKTMTGLELPSAMIGLVWNSMMSMAGGWFFLTIVETFRIGDRPYRLPGLGSYMAAAVKAGDHGAMIAGIVAMVSMIVVVDQIMWRPVLVWAERFKNEETAPAEKPRSWAYDVIRGSRLVAWLRSRRRVAAQRLAPERAGAAAGTAAVRERRFPPLLFPIAATAAGIGALWGAWRLSDLLEYVDAASWLHIAACLGLTAARVISALAIGVLWTVPVGIAIGRSPRLARAAQPVIQVLASFPAPMLYPILAPAMLAIGAPGDVIAVVLMLLGTQWYVLFNVAGGAVSVPQDLREAAAAFRLSGVRRFVTLYLAAVFPSLVTGLVTAAGGAWNASIVAEAVDYGRGKVVVTGIGSLIAQAFDARDFPTLAAATVSLSVTLVFVNRFVWKRLHHVADTRFAMNR